MTASAVPAAHPSALNSSIASRAILKPRPLSTPEAIVTCVRTSRPSGSTPRPHWHEGAYAEWVNTKKAVDSVQIIAALDGYPPVLKSVTTHRAWSAPWTSCWNGSAASSRAAGPGRALGPLGPDHRPSTKPPLRRVCAAVI